ncbi:MAG: LysR family transcriptional regulator [Myxococcales bacterium]|nr:LysR family transcriptional regulator [Myxococcales bacterium]
MELERRGTMAAVAQAVGASPSAVSQQLNLLEEETGVSLLETVGRGVRLTLRARLLAEHAQSVIERLEQAETELLASMDEPTGRIRVACFESILSTLVPPTITRLAENYPQLRVEIIHEVSPKEAIDGLRSHDFDLVMGEELPGYPQAKNAGLQEESLTEDEILLAFPLRGPLSKLPLTLEATKDAPWVMDPPKNPFAYWATAQCRAVGFEPDIRFETPDPGLQLRFVEAGLAIAFVPEVLRRLGEPAVKLVRLPNGPRRRLLTVVRRSSVSHPGIVAFRAGLHKSLAYPPG